jgi:hypothetical protein
MAWQPSRIVPGLTQYLAAKGLAFAAPDRDAEATRPGAVRAGQLSTHMDASSSATMEPDRPLSPQLPPPAKRHKADEPGRMQHPEPSAAVFLSDSNPSVAALAPASSAVSSVKSVDDLPSPLRESLLPFQHEGVVFAINKGGRVMIADDMGLGSRTPRPLSLSRVSHLLMLHVSLHRNGTGHRPLLALP